MSEKKRYYAHGKLLITGEYAVLDGAMALAIPTQKGQWMDVNTNSHTPISWTSKNEIGEVWFHTVFSNKLEIVSSSDTEVAQRLQHLLNICVELNPEFYGILMNSSVETRLEFPADWGLGSSSTLVYLLSKWANVNPYILLQKTFGGSGYDIACADFNSAILFQIVENKPSITPIIFNPPWTDKLYFIYLGKKQISRTEIKKYASLPIDRPRFVQEISEITAKLVDSKSVEEFTDLLHQHEEVVAKTLGYPRIQDLWFPTINGVIKSLGAWGGDFVLFVGPTTEIPKIKELGFETIIPFDEMVIQ